MNTYFIITQAITGKRGGKSTHKFVVVAKDEETAKEKALGHWEVAAGAEITRCELVTDCLCVAAG